MIGCLLLAALLQEPAARTVGDTVWVETRIALPGRMIVRPQPWDLGDLGLVLGPPTVELGVDSAAIAYPLALWYPGEHVLRIPGPIVVSPEGQSDTLPGRSVVVRIASVLPADSSKASLAPEPAADVVPQASRSLLGFLLLELAVAVAATGLAVAWRRRARRRRAAVPVPAVQALESLTGTLDRWADAGEVRAAVDGWAHRAEAWYPDPSERPDAVSDWLARAERAGFTDHAAEDALLDLLAAAKEWTAPRGTAR